jgi:Ca2+:H+ antiporter
VHVLDSLERSERIGFPLVAIIAGVGFALWAAGANATLIFAVSALGVAGLAWMLGIATEEAGEAAGPRLSALLNATFGNAAELIIAVLAVRAGLIDVAKASIIGSVLGNLLFILGGSLFLSGIRHGRMAFDAKVAGVNATMLVLATAALGLPSLFATSHSTSAVEEQHLSVGVAAVMIAVYAAYLFASFQAPEERGNVSPHGARWTMKASLVVLGLTAVGTGLLSEALVESIEPTIASTGISRIFIGLIVIPIIGNVAEHAAALKIAWNGHLDFAMAISYNSALQVALAVSGIVVFASLFFDTTLTLEFTALELAVLAAAAVVSGLVAVNGTSNWIEGAQMLSIYLIAAMVFWEL